ncbi:MAG: GGDEF domain-containing protein [Treponema sp.]|nr:GGDEF domain-containing protein [Treponema sp.]
MGNSNKNTIINKIKQVIPKKIIASVPFELEEQFDQVQLKNTIYRLKILTIAMFAFKLISLLIYIVTNGHIIQSGRLAQLLFFEQRIFNIANSYNFTIIIMFYILISIFSKKNNTLFLWMLCYIFIILNFISINIAMLFTDSDIQILYLFSTTLFLNIFIPNFKPKIFLWTSVLFYLATMGILANHFPFYYSGGIQFFILNTFIAILVIKIIQYNNNVKVFVNMARINALNEKLSELSITDELTKLNNRRAFMDYMDIVWKQSHRLKLPLSVLMLDVDFFKKYNDSKGHLEGDNVLIAIAQCLKSKLKRDTDFIARFGGEEFVCLLPYIEKEKAVNFAQDLVKSIENLNIHHPMNENSEYVTISAGMAIIIPDENYSQKQLLDEADKALYIAKQSGRNRVIIK